MDKIFLNEIRLEVIIGLYEWERKIPQTVELDLEIGVPDCRACVSDAVEDTIDYAHVVARLKESLADTRFHLVEAMAEHIAQLILQNYPTPWVRVSVTKLGLIPGVKRLGVSIERGT